MRLRQQRGVTLIEVLIAVLIFSIGLIGLAGLLVMATRSNHAAYVRTQVSFLATSMADRMRANPIAVWNGNYNATYPTADSQDCDSTACTPADLAKYDKQAWSSQLKTFLANPDASIACSGVSAGYDPAAGGNLSTRPPYGGNCTMTIQWSERRAGDINHADAANQTFAWQFQP